MSVARTSVLSLHRAIESAAPIDGVACLEDGSIRIDFREEASKTQRRAAKAIADSWDWSAPEAATPTLEEELSDLKRRLAALEGATPAKTAGKKRAPKK